MCVVTRACKVQNVCVNAVKRWARPVSVYVFTRTNVQVLVLAILIGGVFDVLHAGVQESC